MNSSSPNSFEQARLYLAEIPGAISGSGGHTQTFKAARVLVQDFDLSDHEALALLREWNLTCSSLWSEAELEHKVRKARKNIAPARIGCKVRGEARQSPRREPIISLATMRGWTVTALQALGCKAEGREVHFPMRDQSRQIALDRIGQSCETTQGAWVPDDNAGPAPY